MTVDLLLGDCLDLLRDAPLFDAIVTDPPGGGRFMNIAFDSDRGGRDRWIAWLAERLAAGRERTKEGGYLLCWSFGRTTGWTHRAIEDAGWRMLGPVGHFHGQGYPKAGKQALKPMLETWYLARNGRPADLNIDACRVRRNWAERGEAWMRSGHSAKPGAEKIAGIPAGNGIACHEGGSFPPDLVLSHCEGCERVGVRKVVSQPNSGGRTKGLGYGGSTTGAQLHHFSSEDGTETVEAWECVAGCDCGWSTTHPAGGDPPMCERCGFDMWWACAVALVDQQSGERKGFQGGTLRRGATTGRGIGYGSASGPQDVILPGKDGGGGASRFYPNFHPRAHYFSKPGNERDAGCEHLLWRKDDQAPIGWRRVTRAEWERLPTYEQSQAQRPKGKVWRSSGNPHATIKGIDHMRWKCRLLTRPAETVGDLFGGAMTVAIAAALEGRNAWSCDIAEEAIEIGYNRLRHWYPSQGDLFAGAADGGIRLHGWTPPAYDYWIPPDEPRERERPPRVRLADPRQVDMFGGREE